MDSVWSRQTKKQRFQMLTGDKKTDVLIIGGGMTGLLCAYFLHKQGVDCLLAEARSIGNGTTQNTTAKITAQHGLCYHKLIKRFGIERAKQYLDANLWAVEQYHTLCQQIPCDYQQMPAYVYTKDHAKKILDETNALARLGYEAKFFTAADIPIHTTGAIKFEQQAQFDPLRFLFHIAKDLPIYENTMIEKIDNGVAYTKHGKIYANQMIVATHFPFVNVPGFYFTKLYQQRSYVIALKGAAAIDGMYIDEKENGISLRGYKDLLLVGGGGHRTGKQGGGWAQLRAFAKEYYPATKEVYHWATQDCMSLDGVPYIGQYAPSMPQVYVATGFNKWGMTSSMVAAGILCDLVQGRANPFAEVFSPRRSMLHKQLFVNLGQTLVDFVNVKTPRCTHLGCALHYNKQEHSWDCSCHGSRFASDGKLIDNPAMCDSKIRSHPDKHAN